MEKIVPGKYVELGYDLYEVDGADEVLRHQTDMDDPEKIIFGVTPGVVKPLEAAIDGLEKGGKFDVLVKSDEAFGPHDPEMVMKLDRDLFLVDGKFDEEFITPGNYVPMMTAEGYRINGKVLKVTDKDVELDFNHPLAGKDVRFKGEILEVRDATPEELHPSCGCGCGCDHDHDCGDGCGEHACGDGCCH